jgi:hypothetical protein
MPQDGLKMDETNMRPTLQENLAVGLNFKIISASKSVYLSRLIRAHEIDIVAIQEINSTSDLNLLKRGNLHRFKLIDAIPNNVHGIATYVRDTLVDCFLTHSE